MGKAGSYREVRRGLVWTARKSRLSSSPYYKLDAQGVSTTEQWEVSRGK